MTARHDSNQIQEEFGSEAGQTFGEGKEEKMSFRKAAQPEAGTRKSIASGSPRRKSPLTGKQGDETRNRFAGSASLGMSPPAGNLATGTLKLIALFFMLIDHLGAVVFPRIPEMRILGRIAFPIYCWCMVVGFHYTKSIPKYLGRILVIGFISQPLYAYVMNHMGHSGNQILNYFIGKPNIFLTLFLGLAALWGIQEKKWYSQIWAPAAAIALATALGVDYGWRGVLFMILLYEARNTRPGIAAVMIAFFLYWGTSYGVTNSFFGWQFDIMKLPGWISQPLSAFMRLETYGLLSLIFILPRYKKNTKMLLWVSYLIYPAHLVIVYLFKIFVGP